MTVTEYKHEVPDTTHKAYFLQILYIIFGKC